MEWNTLKMKPCTIVKVIQGLNYTCVRVFGELGQFEKMGSSALISSELTIFLTSTGALRLVSAIFYQIFISDQMIALQKL